MKANLTQPRSVSHHQDFNNTGAVKVQSKGGSARIISMNGGIAERRASIMKPKRMSCAVWLYLSVLVLVLLMIPERGRAQPSNDAFANGQSLNDSTGSVAGSNVNATKEPGEPNHGGDSGGHSIWYGWTAPASTPVTIDTIGSSFDTLLGVYTGSGVSGLTTIAGNDDIDSNNKSSRVGFTPVAGTTYQIAVDGWGGATGSITLNWTQTAQNLPDLFIWGTSVSPRITTVTFSFSSFAVVEGE